MDSGSLAGKTPSIVAKALPDDRSTIARRHSYRPSTQAASSRPRPAFIERHRGFINAYRLTSQPGEGGITFYTPAGRTPTRDGIRLGKNAYGYDRAFKHS